MNTFELVYLNIILKIICDEEYESVIKEHFYGNTTITSETTKKPTYRLIVTNSLNNIPGIYTKMIDNWFNYATIDCWIDNKEETCYITNFHADTIINRNLLIQYFTSNLFNRLLELKGFTGVHSSCIEKDGKGAIFIGERQSGKTTCMLNLINEGFNLVNNDLAAVKYLSKEDRIESFGISKNIFIRMSKNFSRQPCNKKYLKIAKSQGVYCFGESKLEENRIIITPFELAKLNNVDLIPSTEVNAVIVPQYNPEASKSKFTLLDKKTCTKIINSQIISLIHDTTLFLREVNITSPEYYSSKDCILHLTELPCYLCEQNENTVKDFIFQINKILGILK